MQKKVLPVLFGTLLLDTIGIGMIIPIIPIIFTDPSSPSFLLEGYSVSTQYFFAGLITALFGIMQFIGAPILGELSDAYGRKRLLILGVGVLAVSQMLFGFGIETASIALLLAARAVAGLAGANFSIAQAAIADVSPPEDRAKNFGLVGAAFGIGFILGPLLGGWMAGLTGDPASPFWLAGALGVLNVVFISLFLPETNRHQSGKHEFHILKGVRNLRAAFSDKDARPVYLTNFLYMCGFAFFTSFIGILLVERFGLNEAGIGTFFGIVGFCMIVTQLFILRVVAKRFGERQILRYSVPFVALFMLAYPFLGELAFVYAIVPLLAIAQGLTMANLTALVSRSVSAGKQGAALGINSSLVAFSQGSVPLLAGLSSGALGIAAPFFASALLIFASWTVLFVFSEK